MDILGGYIDISDGRCYKNQYGEKVGLSTTSSPYFFNLTQEL